MLRWAVLLSTSIELMLASSALAVPNYYLAGSNGVFIEQSTPIDYEATTVCTAGSCNSIDMLAALRAITQIDGQPPLPDHVG